MSPHAKIRGQLAHSHGTGQLAYPVHRPPTSSTGPHVHGVPIYGQLAEPVERAAVSQLTPFPV
jgi:hypothetical protein